MQVNFDSQPGSVNRPNEDFVAATPTAVVVLDGLSAPPQLGTGCHHGTPWYVQQLGTTLIAQLSRTEPVDLKHVLARAIGQVAQHHFSTCDLTHPGTPSASVLIAHTTESQLDYLVLFDSTLLAQTTSELHIVTDQRVLDHAQTERDETTRHPIDSPGHRAAVAQLVAAERRHRNKPGGYWVAGADPTAAEHSLTGSIPTATISELALMTDGATCIVDAYHQHNWTTLLAHLATNGARQTIEQVRATELSDPDGHRWPRYKHSDDATIAYATLLAADT